MDKSSDPFLSQVVSACRQALYVAIFFSFFINVFTLTVPLYMLQLYDRVLTTHSKETLFYLTLIALIVLIILALLDIVRSRILINISQWLDNTLSPVVLKKIPDSLLHGLNYDSQSLSDVKTIRQFISSTGIISLFDAPWTPIYLFVIFLLQPILGILATVGALILFSLAIWNDKVTHTILAQANEKNILTQHYIQSSLHNAESIQAMGMMSNIINHWQEKNTHVLQLQTTVSNRSAVIFSISKFFRLALQVLMLGTGAFLVINNQLTAGAMIAASIILARALAPVEQSISVWRQLLNAKQAYERLQKHFSNQFRTINSIKLPKPIGNLNLENIFYRSPMMQKPIIFNVSVQIHPGEMIALIGPSGAGKSTLARLIVGSLQPTAGSVRLDGADIYHWDRTDVGQHIGYLPQDTELFPGTIKDNIARMGSVDDEAVISAAKLAGLHEIILHLPQGYDTEIFDNHILTISGGLSQRIALARALYKEPRLIVLDEPNSNLDGEGEIALLKALLAMKDKGVTQIIIAHRPSIIKYVDRIIMLNMGQIQLIGPRDKILNELSQTKKSQAEISEDVGEGAIDEPDGSN